MAFLAVNHMGELRELCAALGLKDAAVNKLVIEIPVDGAVRCYAVTYPVAESFNALVKFVRAVEVSDRGEVSAVPLSTSDTAKMLARAVLDDDLVAAKALADEIVEHSGGK